MRPSALPPVSANQIEPSGCSARARGWASAVGMANSVTVPSSVMRPMRSPPASLNHSAPSRTTIDSGRLPGVMPAPNSAMRPSGVTRPSRSASPSENQTLPSGPSAMPSGAALARRQRERGDGAGDADAPDAVAGFFGEPQMAVAADRDADRHAARFRQVELAERLRARIEAADLRARRSRRTTDSDPALRSRCRDWRCGSGSRARG